MNHTITVQRCGTIRGSRRIHRTVYLISQVIIPHSFQERTRASVQHAFRSTAVAVHIVICTKHSVVDSTQCEISVASSFRPSTHVPGDNKEHNGHVHGTLTESSSPADNNAKAGVHQQHSVNVAHDARQAVAELLHGTAPPRRKALPAMWRSRTHDALVSAPSVESAAVLQECFEGSSKQ